MPVVMSKELQNGTNFTGVRIENSPAARTSRRARASLQGRRPPEHPVAVCEARRVQSSR